MAKRPPKTIHGSAVVILRNQDKLVLPEAKYPRVAEEELDAIAERADGADVARLVEEIRTLRSFIEVGLGELEMYEKAEKRGRN